MNGDGKISLALGGAKKGKPAPTNGVKRSHAALHDGEDEDQLDGKAQTVSHFDRAAGGAIDEANRPKKEQPLVIKPQANRDWKEASQRNKRQKLPQALQQNGREAEIEAIEKANKPTFGLNVKKRDGEEPAEGEPMDVEAQEQAQQAPPELNGDATLKQKTDEERAMDALLGKGTDSTLVLPAMTEEEAFEQDFRSAPDMATLDDYARVPVEQFGAALLRGMGWKEGEGIGSQRGKKIEKVKIPERRPALLGIGAKEEAAVKEEMGAWGKGSRGKEAKVYNPVLLRDKRTGEMFTEEELEKKRADDERKKYEMEFEEKERRKEKDRRKRDDSRNGERRKEDRDRRRDDSDEEYYRRKEEKRKRREREREESDEEYYRRKEKEKRRRDRDRDHRDSDRERSRRHDSSRERHHNNAILTMASTSTIKTVALCITLFLASALTTLSLRSSTHPSFLPNSSTSSPSAAGRPSNAPKVAYATFLAGNGGQDPLDPSVDDNQDGYYLGARVLVYQLLHSATAGPQNESSIPIPFLVVCTTDVSARKRARLQADGATVILVEKLQADWVTPGAERWRDVLAKLRLFQLVEYQKICFIDADTLVTAPLEGVFHDEATLTQATLGAPEALHDDEAPLPRTYMFATHGDYWGYEHAYPPDPDLSYLNCGFFVFTPSLPLFAYYMSLLGVPGKFDPGFPEQNLLNYAHRRDGNMPWKLLWYGWNVNWPTARDWRGGARSFHAKYWDGDPSHDPVLKAMWREQRSEMEGFWRGREWRGELKG